VVFSCEKMLVGALMNASQEIPGATLWSAFDDICRKAEAEFEQTLKEAAQERDRVINPASPWDAYSHVKAAAEARYSRKEQAAQTARDEKCKRAEGERDQPPAVTLGPRRPAIARSRNARHSRDQPSAGHWG
jgi:hypothetical protein